MIRVECKENGMEMEASGDKARLLVEFTAIIEQFNKRGILDEHLYDVCWKMATLKDKEKTDFMKEELQGCKNKVDKELDEVVEQLENLMKRIEEN